MSLLRAALLVALALPLTGGDCEPTRDDDIGLYAMTPAPPTRTARVAFEDRERGVPRTVTLSQGVVMSVRCWDSCDSNCVDPEIIPADPTVLGVRSIARVGSTRVEHALIGHRPGTTHLLVRSTCAEASYTVTVGAD